MYASTCVLFQERNTNNLQHGPQDSSDFTGIFNDTDISGWNTPTLDESASEASTPKADAQHSQPEAHNGNSRSENSSKSIYAVQRRREQNRISQMAHRQRSKKQVEDLRNQLEECTEYNHTMYRTLQTLGIKTKALALEIDQALTMQPPPRYPEQFHGDSEDLQWSQRPRDCVQSGRDIGKTVVSPTGQYVSVASRSSSTSQSELPWAPGGYECQSDVRYNGFY